MNNEIKQIGTPDIYQINKTSYVGVQLREKRGDKFFDVLLINNDKEIFLARIRKELYNLKILVNNDKILIYSDEFNSITKKMQIIKVYSLYNIDDDIFYSCKEIEALNMFDSNINTNYLFNKNNNISRSDIEKKKRLNVDYNKDIEVDFNNKVKTLKLIK